MKERDCTDPTAIKDWELIAYTDGEELEHVAEHLEHCPACRARLRDYTTIEDELKQLLHRPGMASIPDCPSVDTLRDHYWGHLSVDEHQRIDAHLETCPHCAAELANLDQFIGSKQQEPSSTLLDRAREAAKRARLIVAQLVSPSPRPVPALRGETREVLLFEAEDVALSLNMEQETTGRYTLFGQVLSAEPTSYAGGDVRLIAQDQDIEPIQSTVDASGVALAAGGFTTGALAYIFHREHYHAVIRPAPLTAMASQISAYADSASASFRISTRTTPFSDLWASSASHPFNTTG